MAQVADADKQNSIDPDKLASSGPKTVTSNASSGPKTLTSNASSGGRRDSSILNKSQGSFTINPQNPMIVGYLQGKINSLQS